MRDTVVPCHFRHHVTPIDWGNVDPFFAGGIINAGPVFGANG